NRVAHPVRPHSVRQQGGTAGGKPFHDHRGRRRTACGARQVDAVEGRSPDRHRSCQVTNDDPPTTDHRNWFGHPRGLSTLFFTEMWERFSYYGMRAILVLFMTNAVATGGMGLDDVTATAIYGLYTAAVWLVALPGGWIADRLLGLRRSVFWGGCVIAAGHYTLAISSTRASYLGLVIIVVGTGLLKPSI